MGFFEAEAMRPSRIAYVFLWSFLLSVFALAWWQEPAYPKALWIILASVGGIGLLIIATKRSFGILLIASMLGVSSGLFSVSRVIASAHTSIPNELAGKVVVEGTVSAPPDRRGKSVRYTIQADTIEQSGSTLNINARVLLDTKTVWPRYTYGDRLRATGDFIMLIKPKEESTYTHYLLSQAYVATLDAYYVKRLSEGGTSLFSLLYSFKDGLEAIVGKLYPEPAAALLKGLLTGNRSDIPDDVNDAFTTAGLTHVLAISGFNITVILSVISGCLFWLPLKWRFVPTIIAVIAFTFLTGASASVVRAAVMGILGLVALQTGRVQTSRLTVLWTLFFMLLARPLQLWYDAGFQLSFLALVGLMELSEALEKITGWLPEKFGIKESMQMTLSAQILASPWIVYLFGRLSIVAPFANLVVTPMVPFAMLFGALSLLSYALWLPFTKMLTWIGWLCLTWILETTKLSASVPYASTDIPAGATAWIVAYYAFVIVGGFWLKLRFKTDTRTPTSSPSPTSPQPRARAKRPAAGIRATRPSRLPSAAPSIKARA